VIPARSGVCPAGSPIPANNFGELLLAHAGRREIEEIVEQLAHTLDEIAPGGQANPPSEMITSIVEAIYDDYAKANFTNYELRRERLEPAGGLRAAVQGRERVSFPACAHQQHRRGAGARSDNRH